MQDMLSVAVLHHLHQRARHDWDLLLCEETPAAVDDMLSNWAEALKGLQDRNCEEDSTSLL